MTSTIERLAAFLDGSAEHPETGKRFHEYADEALAQTPKRYYWWRKYVRQMRAQAAAEYAELEQRAAKAEKAVDVFCHTLNEIVAEREELKAKVAEIERRNAELVEAARLAESALRAALAHSAQEKAE